MQKVLASVRTILYPLLNVGLQVNLSLLWLSLEPTVVAEVRSGILATSLEPPLSEERPRPIKVDNKQKTRWSNFKKPDNTRSQQSV